VKDKALFTMNYYGYLERFKERLNNILEDLFGADFNIKEVAGEMGLNPQTLRKYLSGDRQPYITEYAHIVKYFRSRIGETNFDSDYLIGLSESYEYRNIGVATTLGFNDKTTKKICELKENFMLDPLSDLINTSNFEHLLDAVKYAGMQDQFSKSQKSSVEQYSLFKQWVLENELKACVSELTRKDSYGTDEDQQKVLEKNRLSMKAMRERMCKENAED